MRVRVPLAPLAAGGAAAKTAAPAAERVQASFAPRAFELEVTDEAGRLYRLRVTELPGGGVDPQARAPSRALFRPRLRRVLTWRNAPRRRAATAWRAPALTRPCC